MSIYCYKCTTKLEKNLHECPVCKNTNELYPAKSHHLKPETILAEKYWVGSVLREKRFCLTYIGLDVTQNKRLIIHEYYPSDITARNNIVGSEVKASFSSSNELFETGKKEYMLHCDVLKQFSNEPSAEKVIDIVEENNTVYLINEHMGDTSLESSITQNNILPITTVVDLFTPIMQALAKINAKDIFYADISPSSLIFAENKLFLTEGFGYLKAFDASFNMGREKFLSEGYAPKEQYERGEKHGAFTDVYSLSASMYKAVTGITPIEATQRLFIDDLKPPIKLGINISEEAQLSLLKGLSPLPKDRYQSFDEMLSAFSSIKLEGQTNAVQPNISPKEEFDPFKQSYRIISPTESESLAPKTELTADTTPAQPQNSSEQAAQSTAPTTETGTPISAPEVTPIFTPTPPTVNADPLNTSAYQSTWQPPTSAVTPSESTHPQPQTETYSAQNFTAYDARQDEYDNNPYHDNTGSLNQNNDFVRNTNPQSQQAPPFQYSNTFSSSGWDTSDTQQNQNLWDTPNQQQTDNAWGTPNATQNQNTWDIPNSPQTSNSWNNFPNTYNQPKPKSNNKVAAIIIIIFILFFFFGFPGSFILSNLFNIFSSASYEPSVTNYPDISLPDIEDEEYIYLYDEIITLEMVEMFQNMSQLNDLALEGCHFDDTVLQEIFLIENLIRLDISNNDSITNIDGIQNLVNLEILDISATAISDLSPLEELPSLFNLIANNMISFDLKEFSSLTRLTFLEISNNYITDLSPISNLINLVMLDVSYNEISDISAISSLEYLDTLYAHSNYIVDLSPLSLLEHLTTVYVSFNEITDILPLEKMENLTFLDISYNYIQNLSPLANCHGIYSLYANNNDISDITPLANLTSLVYLNLSTNSISDITAFESMTMLAYLDISNNQISNLSVLSDKASLEELKFANNLVTELPDFTEIPLISHIDASLNSISDISQLSTINSLTYLDLSNNTISDITPLSNLYSDEYSGIMLDLSNNLITDISSLPESASFHTLNLYGNQIINFDKIPNLTLNAYSELAFTYDSQIDWSTLSESDFTYIIVMDAPESEHETISDYLNNYDVGNIVSFYTAEEYEDYLH